MTEPSEKSQRARKLYNEAFAIVNELRILEPWESPDRFGYSKAQHLLEEALALNPDFILARRELAVVLRKLEKNIEVVHHRKIIKETMPEDHVNRYNLAKTLHDLDWRAEAVQEAKELADLRPDDAKFQSLYAEILHESGRYKESLIQAEKLARHQPGAPKSQDIINSIATTQIRRLPVIIRWWGDFAIPILGLLGIFKVPQIDSLSDTQSLILVGLGLSIIAPIVIMASLHLIWQFLGAEREHNWHPDDFKYLVGLSRDLGIGLVFYGIGGLYALFTDWLEAVMFLGFVLWGIHKSFGYAVRVEKWGRWIIAQGISWAVASFFSWISLHLFGYQVWHFIGMQFVAGFVAGGLQWLCIRHDIENGKGWILATAISWAVGWILIQSLWFPFDVAEVFYTPIGSSVTLLRVLPHVGTFVVFGVITGFIQWFVLRRLLKDSWWWIPVCAVGWLVGLSFSQTQFPGFPLDSFSDVAVTWTITGVMIGFITGIPLLILVNNKKAI